MVKRLEVDAPCAPLEQTSARKRCPMPSIRPLTHPSIHSFTHLPTYSFIHLHFHPSIHPLTHRLVYSWGVPIYCSSNPISIFLHYLFFLPHYPKFPSVHSSSTHLNREPRRRSLEMLQGRKKCIRWTLDPDVYSTLLCRASTSSSFWWWLVVGIVVAGDGGG